MKMIKALFCWSGGKDSAYCLHKVLTENVFEVTYLLTTVNDEFKRVSMHGTREELLDQQADAIGIPLIKVRVREGNNSEYERNMEAVLRQIKADGITHVIFGDIFLEDLRAYREANLGKAGMTAVFPLWKTDTRALIHDFVKLGFKTLICCTNDAWLDASWLAREIDAAFLSDLPANVDPCGENGEYHTFCYDGPVFKQRIPVAKGEQVYKALDLKTSQDTQTTSGVQTKGFWFCDLVPE